MKHKLLRGLVALVLVCVLVVNVSPIRAEASALPEVANVVTKVIPFNPGSAAVAGGAALGVQVFAWVCAALGVIFITTPQLIEMAQAYQEFSGDLEIGVFYYPDGTWSYGVDMNFVQRVHAFLWQTGIVVKNTELELDAVQYPPAEALAEAKAANYSVLVYYRYNGGPLFYYLAYSNESQIKVNNSGGFSIRTVDTGAYIYLWQDSTQQFNGFKTLAVSGNKYYVVESAQHFGQMIHPDVQVTIEDATIESVADPGTLDSDDGWQNGPYRDWHSNRQPARSPQTGEEIEVLPIPLNPNGPAELPDGVTQPDVWNGSQAEMLPDMQPTPDGSLAQTPWEGFKKWISEGWKSIIQAIPTADSIAQSIGNVIKPIFVPDADFISEKWNAIRSRFDFADSISSSGELILDVLNGIDPEPPVIYVDLGDAEGSYYLGGQVAFLDLRWYERYKPTGDAIISAFLWLVFVWRMFIKLPGIIGGLPGDFVMQGVTDLGFADWLPARKKEYENQRQQNRRFFKK